LVVEEACTMSIKNLIFFMIFIAYTAYYAVIFFGLVKKNYIVDDESATTLQKAVAFVTPQSPLERNKEVREQINILNQHKSFEQENLRRYEEWREKAIANPPA